MIDIKQLEKDARARKIPVMLDDGLAVLIEEVRKVKPHRILEIGTAVGFSGIMMLENAPDNTILDTIEIDNARYDEAKENFKNSNFSNRVNQYLGDCIDILPDLVNANRYDIVFIDAAKSKYLDCLKFVTDCVNSGGEIIADNVYFRGMVRSSEEPPRKYRALVKALRRFIEYLEGSGLYDFDIYERGDGVAVIKPKIINVQHSI